MEEKECTCGKDEVYGGAYYPHSPNCATNMEMEPNNNEDQLGEFTPKYHQDQLHKIGYGTGDWEKGVIALAKQYADASYLHSEENEPKENEELALKYLVEHVGSLLASQKEETERRSYQKGYDDGYKKCEERYYHINGGEHL